MSISNPLKHCSLKVKNFRVIGEMESCNKTTGPTFECDYHAFELPPLSSIVKELIVMPLHFGLLTITGKVIFNLSKSSLFMFTIGFNLDFINIMLWSRVFHKLWHAKVCLLYFVSNNKGSL